MPERPSAPPAPQAPGVTRPPEGTDLDPAALAEIGRRFIGAIPWAQALGMEVLRIGRGEAVMRVAWDPRLVGDPATGVIHGGVLTALLDSCCGAAVMSHPDGPISTATIDLRIDYMRAARPGTAVLARAECYRAGRSVAFVRAVAYEDDETDPVATVAAAFASQGRKEGRR